MKFLESGNGISSEN